jgi:hypothetical protein
MEPIALNWVEEGETSRSHSFGHYCSQPLQSTEPRKKTDVSFLCHMVNF